MAIVSLGKGYDNEYTIVMIVQFYKCSVVTKVEVQHVKCSYEPSVKSDNLCWKSSRGYP